MLILQYADIVDALLSKRVYKKKYSKTQALKILTKDFKETENLKDELKTLEKFFLII